MDTNEDDAITPSDIRLTTNIDRTGVDPEDVFMQWNLLLGGALTDAGTGIDFDLGIPGLGLETRGSMEVDIEWDLSFGFGVDPDQGFYLDISDVNELEVIADVTLPGAGLTGRLAFLQLDADDNGGTHLGATIAVDVKNRVNPDDTLLGFAEIGNIGLEAGLAAEAVRHKFDTLDGVVERVGCDVITSHCVGHFVQLGCEQGVYLVVDVSEGSLLVAELVNGVLPFAC